MKTLTQVQTEIDAIMNMNAPNAILEPRKHGQLTKRLALLRTCAAYLRDQPLESFVAREKARIENRLEAIGQQYSWWVTDKPFATVRARREAYDKLFSVSELKEQLATLTYLLEEPQSISRPVQK